MNDPQLFGRHLNLHLMSPQHLTASLPAPKPRKLKTMERRSPTTSSLENLIRIAFFPGLLQPNLMPLDFLSFMIFHFDLSKPGISGREAVLLFLERWGLLGKDFVPHITVCFCFYHFRVFCFSYLYYLFYFCYLFRHMCFVFIIII